MTSIKTQEKHRKARDEKLRSEGTTLATGAPARPFIRLKPNTIKAERLARIRAEREAIPSHYALLEEK